MHRSTLSLHDYVGVLRRRVRLIAACALVLTLIGSLWSLTRPSQYLATAEILVDFDLSAQVADPASQSRYVTDRERRLENELRFARSREVDKEAERRLGAEADPTIDADLNADIIVVSARSEDPVRAAREANAYASVYVQLRASKNAQRFLDGIASIDAVLESLRDELDERTDAPQTAETETDKASISEQIRTYEARRTALSLLADANSDSSASIISAAEEPEAPVSPRPVRTAMMSLVLGLVLGAIAALAVDLSDDRLQGKADLDAAMAGAPVLGLIPRRRRSMAPPAALATDVPLDEAFRNLRTSVRFISLRRPLRAIQVTSANPSEGKTTTACHLAVSLASGGIPVVLIDGDLRNPRVHERFGLPADGGLAAVLLGDLSLEDAMVAVPGCPQLWVIVAGAATENPADLLWPEAGHHQATTLHDLIDRLVSSGVTVVLDSPPVLPVADALTLSRFVDGTLFVAAARSTRAAAVQRAVELLQQADARIIGSVLNRVERGNDGTYGQGYGYGPAPQKAPDVGPDVEVDLTQPALVEPGRPNHPHDGAVEADGVDDRPDTESGATPRPQGATAALHRSAGTGRARPPRRAEVDLVDRLRGHLGLDTSIS